MSEHRTHDYAALEATLARLKKRIDDGECINLTDLLITRLPTILAALEAAQQVKKMSKALEQARKALLKFNWDELNTWRCNGGYGSDPKMGNHVAEAKEAFSAIEEES